LLQPDLLAVLTSEYEKFLIGIIGNIKCIHSGVDTELFKPMQTNKQQLPERPWFLSTASLTPAKRIHLIIDAISKIGKGSFIFTSNGPEREKLLSLAEKKIPYRYEYLGPVKSEQLPAIYNFCDYYVNASVSEGLSTSISEAMACNLPVVYQKDENREWQIDGAGIGCNTIDTNEFALALTAIVNDKFGNIPRKQAEKFSLKHSAQLYDEEIRKVL
jgi:glycosyltransferase involved in cell wall biosynthesis